MKIQNTIIEDTFAEAFSMSYARIVVTAEDDFWLDAACREATGYGSSVIGCDAEAGVDQMISADLSPDGRPGASLLFFAFDSKSLGKAVLNRVGQCIMTCPSTAVFEAEVEAEVEAKVDSENRERSNAVPEKLETGGGDAASKSIPLGKMLRFFGDGFQKSKVTRGKRYWRIPVMDGEFVVVESARVGKGVAGGNFLIQSTDRKSGLNASKAASVAISQVPGVIAPFPAGVVRSGSKVGSIYQKLRASTSDAFCPTLRGRTDTKIVAPANFVHEIVIDGTTFENVAIAMRVGIQAACSSGAICISAGNYGGNLGKHHFHLHELLAT